MTWARQQADAVSSSRWSDDEVRLALGQAHDNEWSRILAAQPYVRAATRTVTADTNGQVAMTALDGSTGDTLEKFYRVLAWHDGQRLYSVTSYQDAPLATIAGAYAQMGPYSYYPFGDVFQVVPVASGTIYTVAVNHKPQNAYSLTADASTVVFPENQDLLIAVVAAQIMLRSKGGAEADGAALLEETARDLRESLLDDLSRRYVGATVMRFPDTAASWGG